MFIWHTRVRILQLFFSPRYLDYSIGDDDSDHIMAKLDQAKIGTSKLCAIMSPFFPL